MAGEVNIRRATLGDEAALSLVGQATFLETFAGVLDGAAIVGHCAGAHGAARYRDWLEDPPARAWRVEAPAGGAPVGYLVVAPPDLAVANPDEDLELKRIYLLGRYQGNGAGKRLLAQAVEFARASGAARLLLGVYAGNDAARGFYLRQGFSHVAERTFHVGGKAYDDHVLALRLGT